MANWHATILMDCESCGHEWNMVDPPYCQFCRWVWAHELEEE